MKIGVITCCDRNYEPVANITFPINQRYCESQGYVFDFRYFEKKDSWAETVWMKISLLKGLMFPGGYDWLMWIDADAMVMNHRIKIEDLIAKCSPEANLIISSDLHGLNAGVFIIRNCLWSKVLLSAVEDKKDEYLSHKYPEQEAMDSVISEIGNKERVAYLPQWLLNQFWLQWIPGDFIIHHSGGSVEDKVAGLTPFLEKVQY